MIFHYNLRPPLLRASAHSTASPRLRVKSAPSPPRAPETSPLSALCPLSAPPEGRRVTASPLKTLRFPLRPCVSAVERRLPISVAPRSSCFRPVTLI